MNCRLKITKPDLIQLLEVATKNQLFQFDDKLYEQVDGVAIGSPMGLVMANVFLCSIDEKLEQKNKVSNFYRTLPEIRDKMAVVRAH